MRADLAADHRGAGDDRGRSPRDVRGEDEVHAGDAVDDRGEDVLQGVRALQVLREDDAEEADEEDPLGRPEVAAVDPRCVDAERRPQPALALAADLALGEQAVQARLQDDEHEGDGDEDRHDGLEGRRRQHEQQHGAGRPAQQGGRAQAQHAPALALELAPIADRTRH